MIITKLKGGLGNQLFQYAAGRALAEKCATELLLDASDLESRGGRNFQLDNFNVLALPASQSAITAFLSPANKIINRVWPWPQYKIIKEKKFSYTPELFDTIRGRIYLNGYWQSWKYFSGGIEEGLKKELTLKNEPGQAFFDLGKKIEIRDSVSLHIRRGDYLTGKIAKIFPVCPLSYYYEAIKKLAAKIVIENIFVFSDDISWAKENCKLNYPLFFIEPDLRLTIAEEMILMSRCRHNIIANSSFSWWAAWLNPNPDKIIFAPDRWFNDDKNTADLIPTTWNKI